MNKECFSIISAVSIKHKILSCVLAFFVLISSMNLLNFEEQKKTIMKSVEVSTTVVLSQFFNISALPVSAISKMVFVVRKSIAKKTSSLIQPSKETATVEQQPDKATETIATAKETENNKGTDTKGDNAIKASIEYSITSGISAINRVINSKWLKDLDITDIMIETNFVRYVERVNFVLSGKVINVMFVMMLLLAILLARRNVGDNNIINNNINNIKNKMITRFI
jgi:hypothetical protein